MIKYSEYTFEAKLKALNCMRYAREIITRDIDAALQIVHLNYISDLSLLFANIAAIEIEAELNEVDKQRLMLLQECKLLFDTINSIQDCEVWFEKVKQLNQSLINALLLLYDEHNNFDNILHPHPPSEVVDNAFLAQGEKRKTKS